MCTFIAVSTMPRSQQEVKKILSYYKKPSFAASFSSPEKFKYALKEHLGIDIGLRELRDILEKDLAYNMSKVKKSHLIAEE